MKTNDKSNFQCAKIIKGLNALSHLMTNIRYNYFALDSIYKVREKIEDIEYKEVECAFNNFILTSSILKQYIKSFEKDLDTNYIKSKKYKKTVDSLFNNEWYLILLGMRNYLQHVFHFKIGSGNLFSDGGEEDLLIANYTLLKYDELHPNKPENIAFQRYFKYFFALPIMDFATENILLIEKFYHDYDKIIHEHYKAMLAKYDKVKDVDQYAMDMHEIYLENINSFNDKNVWNAPKP